MASIKGTIGILACGVAMLAAGCATRQAPSAEERQALAPTGTLRIGLTTGNPMTMVRDPAGQARGVGHDLGIELARRLGVPFELKTFDGNPRVLEALKAGSIDVAFQNATPARMKDMDFTGHYAEIEATYLVRPGSPIDSRAALDRPGVRLGAGQGSTSFATFSREFKQATIVAVPSTNAAIEMLASGKLDAFGTAVSVLLDMADKLPGARILKEPFGVERIAIAVPKGREAGLAYASRFVSAVKSEGLIGAAIARAGARGVKVAAPE